MKKILAILALTAVATFAAPFNKGDNTITASVGYGMAGITGDAGLPPLSLSYDYGFNENISLGAIGGYASSSQKLGAYGFDYTYILVGARGAYHFNDLLKGQPIDPYIGALLGYNIVSATTTGTGLPAGFTAAGVSYMAFGGYLGARYWFTPSLAAQLELGYGAGLAAIGLSYRL